MMERWTTETTGYSIRCISSIRSLTLDLSITDRALWQPRNCWRCPPWSTDWNASPTAPISMRGQCHRDDIIAAESSSGQWTFRAFPVLCPLKECPTASLQTLYIGGFRSPSANSDVFERTPMSTNERTATVWEQPPIEDSHRLRTQS